MYLREKWGHFKSVHMALFEAVVAFDGQVR